jgi:N-methylhydantoinase A
VTAGNLQAAYDAFIKTHEAIYGYAIEDEIIELVSFRVTVSGKRAAPHLAVATDGKDDAVQPPRQVHFRGHGFVSAAVYRRYSLAGGARLDGPCVIEEPGSTILVEPGMTVDVLPDGQLIIQTGTEEVSA